jgi:hypothetical protein
LSDHSKRKPFGRRRKIFPDTLAKPQGNDESEAEEHQRQSGKAARHQPGADESNPRQCAETKGKARERGHFHKGRRRQDQKTEQESRHRKLRPLPGRKQNADADGERKKEEVYPQRPAKDQEIRKRHQRKQGHGRPPPRLIGIGSVKISAVSIATPLAKAGLRSR